MAVLAMYVPKLHSFDVWFRIFLVVIIAAAAFAYARQRFGTVPSATAIAVGWLAATGHGFYRAFTADLGDYGDICRKWNSCPLPDWCFSVFAYFDVGWGALLSVAGIVAGLIVLAIGHWLFKLATGNTADVHQPEHGG